MKTLTTERRARRCAQAIAVAIGAIAIVFSALAAPETAQSPYPAKPIRIVVPFSAGGSTDLLARGIGERLTRAWGQQVVVDNRPGADGIVATEIVAKANPDGYTLLMNAIGHAANASLYHKLPYETLRDFAPVILAADVPMVLAVHPQVKVNTVSELVALARAKPGQLNCATGGIGASHHLAAELFRIAAKIQFLEVHYKGAAPALLELVSGRMDMMFTPMLVSMTHVKAGRLKALGVTSPQRVVIAPDLPTIAESGVPGYEARAWYGLVAPAKLDPAIVAKLNREIDQALRSTEFRDRLLAAGAVPMGGSSQEFGDFIRREVQKYAAVVKEAGIRVD
jgi:tripartite-type tricarboxylate transporter receptor subunit TctC